jgi:hypothetical protein
MKRDMELIRKVLLAAQDGQLNSPIDGYSTDEVKYHKALTIELTSDVINMATDLRANYSSSLRTPDALQTEVSPFLCS